MVERNWVPLSLVWDEIEVEARMREQCPRIGASAQKIALDEPHLPGVAGEKLFAMQTGRVLQTIHGRSDGGIDFTDPDGTTIDVKSTVHLAGRVHLILDLEPKRLCDVYVLTVVDLRLKRGAVVGWIEGETLVKAPIGRLRKDRERDWHLLNESRLHLALYTLP